MKAEAPVCYDCHGEHEAAKPGSKDPTEHPALASSQLCANCHANAVLMKRFGLDPERFSTYIRTYHGLAVLRGSPRAASCVSCHETHAIRSQSDSRSPVHQENLEKTCAQCHPNASPDFARISVHPVNQKERNPIAYYFRVGYIWLIVAVLGGMIIHNAIILLYYLVEHWRTQKSKNEIRRFDSFQVAQHLVLFLSFTILAVTGFALKFPEAGWTQILVYLGMSESLRALIHRGAAVVLMSSSVVQLIYFTVHRSGRREVVSLIPRWSDFTGLLQNMRFYLRLSGVHPQFDRYDYAEKAEYLALIWGTAVMTATGLVLWFPEVFLRFLPVWGFEVSEVIHYYEAILAVAAVIIWHFFFTIFHPEKYPMSTTWLDGKISEEEQIMHHPLEQLESEQECKKPDPEAEGQR